MGRLIFRAFQCEMKLDYITVSRTTILTLPTHALQPQNFVRILCNDSEAIFRVFQLFSQEIKYFYPKNT